MHSNTRGKRLIFPLIFSFFIFLFTVNAATTHETLSSENLTYTSNPIQITNTEDSIISKTHESFSPLVADLNNDGINEIIVIDTSNPLTNLWFAYAYQGNTLTSLDSININMSNAVGNVYSNFEIMDYDDDGNKEIYWADYGDGGCFKWLTFNSTNQFNTGQFCAENIAAGSPTTYMLKCHDGQNICALLKSKQTFSDQYISAHYFNVTHATSSADALLLTNDAGINNGKCMSNIKSFAFGDHNPNNGDRLELVQSYMVVDGGTQGCIVVGSVDVTNMSDATALVDSCTSVGASIWSDTQPNCIADEYSYHIGAPLVTDINGFPSDGSEVVFAVPTSTSGFKLLSYKIDGTFIDDYPDTGSGDGSYVSNTFKANAMSSSGYNDFCAVGYNVATGTESEVVCASEINTAPVFWIFTTDTVKFDYSTAAGNITPTRFHYPNLAYGVEHDDGNGYTEIMTDKGIHRLDTSDNDLVAVYNMPFTNLQASPIDAELVGYDDIIAGSGTGGLFYYMDDGFTNSNCEDDGCTTEIYTNPCILDGSVIQNGTQIQIRVSVTDADGDDININVTLFEGAPYEQSQNASNQTSGSIISFLFNLDGNTTNTATLDVDVWDHENPSKIENNHYNFIVAPNGEVYGDDSCSQNVTQVTAPTTATDTVSAEENVLDSTMDSFTDTYGISRQAIWYLVLVVFLAFMGWHTFRQPNHMAGGVSLAIICSFAWIFFGSVLGYVPFGHLLVVVLLCLIGVAVYFASALGLGRQAGG